MNTAPYPFPTASRHDPPAVQPMRPVERAPDEAAVDHGIEESFPASDPVSVNITRAEPTTPRANMEKADGETRRVQWRSVLRASVVAGACASVASTAVLAWRGRTDAGNPFAPTNSVSRVLWDRRALPMTYVYAALAIGLAVGCVLADRGKNRSK